MTTEEAIERGEAKLLFIDDDFVAEDFAYTVEDTDPDEVGLRLLNGEDEEAALYLTTEQARDLSNALNRAATRAADPSITTDERIERHRMEAEQVEAARMEEETNG